MADEVDDWVPAGSSPQTGADDWVSPAPIATSPGVAGTATDVAKSAGVGLGEGAIGIAGSMGDIRTMAGNLARKIGVDPAIIHHTLQQIPAYGPLLDAEIRNAPTSQQIQSKVEDYTGKFYEPQTMAGRYARTAGQFAPAMVGGPEGLASRALTRVAAPAVAGQTAEELARGTALEPYAKPAASLVAGVGAAGLSGALSAARQARVAPAIPSAEDYKAAVDNSFNNLRGYGVELPKPHFGKMVDDTLQEMEGRGLTESNSKQIYDALNRVKNAKGQNITFNDIESLRQELGHVQPDQRLAASIARSNLYDYLQRLKPEDAAVNGQFVSRLRPELREALANSATQHQLENLAEIRNFAENSTRDTNEAILAKWRTILASPQRRRQFPPEIQQAMTQSVREGVVDKTLGALAKLSPEKYSGVVPGLLGATLGHYELLGIPAVGLAAKTARNIMSGRAINNIETSVAQSGPLYKKQLADYTASLPPSKDPALRVYARQPAAIGALPGSQEDERRQPSQ